MGAWLDHGPSWVSELADGSGIGEGKKVEPQRPFSAAWVPRQDVTRQSEDGIYRMDPVSDRSVRVISCILSILSKIWERVAARSRPNGRQDEQDIQDGEIEAPALKIEDEE
jgi:hypothetical protein